MSTKTQHASAAPQTVDGRVAGSFTQVENLVELYLTSTHQDLPELDRALARGDVLKVASMAHRLKHAAAKAGAAELSEAAGRIEACYRKGAFEILPFQVEAFRRAQLNYRNRIPD